MTIREWVNRNSAVVMIVVIVVLILALAYVIKSSMRSGSAQAPPKWFYCLQTQQLYGADIKSIPPVESPWGGEGVEAIVYFCDDDCKGEPRIAHLTKFSPELKRLIERRATPSDGDDTPMPPMMEQMAGTLVSDPDDIEWYPVISSQGSKIKSTPFDCGGEDEGRMDCVPDQITEKLGEP